MRDFDGKRIDRWMDRWIGQMGVVFLLGMYVYMDCLVWVGGGGGGGAFLVLGWMDWMDWMDRWVGICGRLRRRRRGGGGGGGGRRRRRKEKKDKEEDDEEAE